MQMNDVILHTLIKSSCTTIRAFAHFIPNDHHDTNFVRIIIGATGFRIACAIRHVRSFRTRISLSGQE